MEFDDRFLPLAGEVGLLANVTYFFFLFAAYALIGSFVFALSTRTSVAPEHRTSRVLTAMIGLIAGISYTIMSEYFRGALHAVARNPANYHELMHDTYFAIGQLRYVDWAFTTPLLLIKMPLMLKIKPHEIKGALWVMLAADFLMILTGYIGQQQLASDGTVLAMPHYVWGTISTVFYILIPLTLYRIWQRFRSRATESEEFAFRLVALTTVTFWGVYPIGYILTAAFPEMDFNWIHLAYSIADVINKAGVGAVFYLAGAKALRDRVDIESPEYALRNG